MCLLGHALVGVADVCGEFASGGGIRGKHFLKFLFGL